MFGICWLLAEYKQFVLAAVVAAPIEVTEVGAVVVVEVKMAVAEGKEAVASFINPQIPLVTWLTASTEAPAASA